MPSNAALDVKQTPLKIGLISDSAQVSTYTIDFITWAKNQPYIELKYFLLHQISSTKDAKTKSPIVRLINTIKKNGLKQTLTNIIFLSLKWCENQRLKKIELFKNHLKSYNILNFDLSTIELSPIVSKSGLVHRFSDEDIKTVKQLDFDLILRCGGPILQGPILNAAKFGIISFHHGNNLQFRGDPAGFWEVLKEEDTTGFIIQELSKELDAGRIFFRGFMRTKGYWLINQANIYLKSTYYLKDFITKLSQTKKLPKPYPNLPYSSILYKKPGIWEIFKYVKGIFSRKIRTFFKHKPKWHVAFVHSDWRDAVLWKGIELPCMPGKGLADPFLYHKENKDYCFVEEINSATNRGTIAVYELFSTYSVRLGTACEEQFHLSFPYLFEYKNKLYMLPETSENNDIRIYECVEFPLQWKLKKVLINNISAADSLLINKDNRWWLFTNIDHWNDDDHCEEMAIYSAKSPFSNKWTSHPLNPIYVDASRARNSGFFISSNTYYRVSQSQGFHTYGKSIVINEITALTQQRFHESKVVEIHPNFKKNILGTHHFHTNGSITAFDYFK